MSVTLSFLAGGGEAARMIRERDWSDHSLGPPEGWSEGLRVALSLVLNSPESMILAWGPDLTFFFNETYFPLLGPRLPWAMGERFDVVWADAWEQAKPIIDDAFAGRSRRFEDLPWQLDTDRGGRETWWSFSYSRVLDADGAVAGLFIFTNETTGRVLSDAALSRSEDDLRALNATLEKQVQQRTAELNHLWATSPDLLLVIDFDGVFRKVNPAWTTLLGYDPKDLVGRHVSEFVLPEDDAKTREAYETAAKGGLPTVENRYRHRDGSTRWISWVAAPSGDLTYATGRDVTARVLAEEKLAVAQEALRQSQKMEAVGQLTGGVAHDFNNLLTVIRSSTDLLRRPDLPEERRARYVGAIADTVDRAAKLTAQLLAFARRQSLRPEAFDAGAGVRSISEMMATLTGARIRIEIHVPDVPVFLNADPSQFDTALVNLAVNARDAMDGVGRIAISVEAVDRMPAVRAHGAVRGDFVAVSVTDTGSGIPAGTIDRIFEPFFTTKGVGQGTGLGLSQVFGFAKQSGGEITVESRVGEGSTFTLFLPRAAAVVAVVEDEEPEPLVDGHGTCVLLVEDNMDVGNFATQSLAELGYVAVWATDAEKALTELAEDASRFDVVFSDVVMPGMNGIDLAHRIRQDHHDLPVLLTSGYSHVLARDGAHGFELLHKPYSVVQLSRLLRKVGTRKPRRAVMER